MEIFFQFQSQRNFVSASNPYEVAAVLFSMYREDLIYADDVCYQFTTRQHEGFNTFSHNFREKFGPGYAIDKTGAVCPVTAKTINFKKQFDMLRSKDEKLFEDAQWIYDGDFRFLDGQDIGANHVGFTSFPRSGNSFMRRILE